MNRCHIPERFEKEIVLHTLRVLKHVDNSPIMLSIEGPTGVGKTYQCETILRRMGVTPIILSAGMFESKDAGEPARKLREKYDKAIKEMQGNINNPYALIIDDADVAFGEWKSNTQYTVNTQQVIGELMNIANISPEKGKVRIPIFLTGNDISRIYASLRRTGRMNFYYWEPEPDEMVDMVYAIMSEWLDMQECRDLIDYSDTMSKKIGLERTTIALYSTIAAFIYDEYLWESYLEAKSNCFCGTIISNLDCSLENVTLKYDDFKKLADKHIQEIAKSRKNYISPLKENANHDKELMHTQGDDALTDVELRKIQDGEGECIKKDSVDVQDNEYMYTKEDSVNVQVGEGECIKENSENAQDDERIDSTEQLIDIGDEVADGN